MTSSEWLLRNAILQVAFSSFLGWLMLLPRQKRGGGALAVLLTKDFTAAHLDWLMLAFMQFGAAVVVSTRAIPYSSVMVACLIFGGWANPLSYVFRAFGVNGFAMGGDVTQRIAASIGALSSSAITVGWGLILVGVFG
ncbi:MAG: hypothetical protein DI536_10580 [Archangium gephyra]|uniref:Uncharacterized protein n=1 Tax=Archangium gephyra TaxID=48 RepID=A0A2W5TME4_9BACT|nr:MAG: hypothetical protein DI536_10580 [Archangium gephyra]